MQDANFGNRVLVWGELIEQQSLIGEGKHAPFAQRVQDPVHARNGQLAQSVDIVELLIVKGTSIAAITFRGDRQWTRIRRSRALDEASRDIPVRSGVHPVGKKLIDGM